MTYHAASGRASATPFLEAATPTALFSSSSVRRCSRALAGRLSCRVATCRNRGSQTITSTQLFRSVKPFRYHAVLMLPDTFGFLDKVLIKLRSHFGRSFEHYIRLALAGEAAKVNSFPGHLLKAFMNAPATLFTDFLA